MPGAQWRPALIAEGVKMGLWTGRAYPEPPAVYIPAQPVEPCGVLPGILRPLPPQPPGLGHPLPASVGAAAGWEGLVTRLPGRPSTRPSPVTALPGMGGLVGALQGRRWSGPWEGGRAASPVSADGLRLHLDRTEPSHELS